MSQPDELPLIQRAARFADRTAVLDRDGEFTYARLLQASGSVAGRLLEKRDDLAQEPIAFLFPPGFDWVAVQWGIWRAGGVAVPLCPAHPLAELVHVIEDSRAARVLVHPSLAPRLEDYGGPARCAVYSGEQGLSCALPEVSPQRRALIVYTSGTTGRPKGVVTTHLNVAAQIQSLVRAWEWTGDDHILHVLPLHHTHGIVNALLCALWAGALCEFAEFEPGPVWERFERGDVTLFMAVPTIYVRLIRHWRQQPPPEQARQSGACRSLRLMVSGSAALPAAVHAEWEQITGRRLLERYGTTETGMALSNPLEGERRAGSVGRPLPGVEVRLVGEEGEVIEEEGVAGEIQVRGSGVFLEYWGRPRETASAFEGDWFITGDQAVVEDGYYRILGRGSVDIIKTGGFKVSALEVEQVLATHPLIRECAVVGVEDTEWGERVCAAVVTRRPLSLDELRRWSKERLAGYKIPSRLLIVENLPRNVMGKVRKPEIKSQFEDKS